MDKLERISRKLEIDEKTNKIVAKQADKYEEIVRKLKRSLREARDYAKQGGDDSATIYQDLEEKAAEIMEQSDDRRQAIESRHAASMQIARDK